MAADDIEEKNRATAVLVMDLFLPDDDGLDDAEVEALELENEPKVRALFAKLNPVEAACVALHVCAELDPEEIADFLAVLEETASE